MLVAVPRSTPRIWPICYVITEPVLRVKHSVSVVVIDAMRVFQSWLVLTRF